MSRPGPRAVVPLGAARVGAGGTPSGGGTPQVPVSVPAMEHSHL